MGCLCDLRTGLDKAIQLNVAVAFATMEHLNKHLAHLVWSFVQAEH